MVLGYGISTGYFYSKIKRRRANRILVVQYSENPQKHRSRSLLFAWLIAIVNTLREDSRSPPLNILVPEYDTAKHNQPNPLLKMTLNYQTTSSPSPSPACPPSPHLRFRFYYSRSLPSFWWPSISRGMYYSFPAALVARTAGHCPGL